MISKISLFLWISSILGIMLLQPKIELPLMHYHLLMLLHLILLGVVLFPLLQQLSRHDHFEKISWTLILTGFFTILLGFLIAPRTAMIKDGGFFLTAGITLLLGPQLKHPGSLFFWPSIALIETCLLGYKLGGVLDRKSVDPIPFSIISAHAVGGLFLALLPMIFLSHLSGKEINPQKTSIHLTSLFFGLGIIASFYLYQLPVPDKLLIFSILLSSICGIYFIAIKPIRIFLILTTLTTTVIIHMTTDMHFEGSTIGFVFFSLALILASLVWKPLSTLHLILVAVASLTIVAGLFFQNHIMILSSGLIQIGLIIKFFTKIKLVRDERGLT